MDTENPENFLLEILKMSGRDPTNSMQVICDICSSQASGNTMGGAVIREKEKPKGSINVGMWTYSCQECFDNFVIIPKSKRKANCSGQKTAIKYGIGTDPDSYFKFPKDRTFRQNTIEFKSETKRQYPNISSWVLLVEEGNCKEEKNYDNRGLQKSCNGCKKFFLSINLMTCGQCKLANYCSKTCQKNDWIYHKPDCNSLKK